MHYNLIREIFEAAIQVIDEFEVAEAKRRKKVRVKLRPAFESNRYVDEYIHANVAGD